jgi:hypothetical protein
MERKSVKELIAELQQLRIRETIVIAEIREAVQGADEIDRANGAARVDDVNLVAIEHGFTTGDRVRIKNKIRKPATAGPSWTENKERFATVTRVTVDQVHLTTDNGTKTWRAPNNLRFI